MDIAINQAEYSNTPAGPVVHIFGREADGTAHEVKVTGFRPYFWVRESEAHRPHSDKVEVTDDRAFRLKASRLSGFILKSRLMSGLFARRIITLRLIFRLQPVF